MFVFTACAFSVSVCIRILEASNAASEQAAAKKNSKHNNPAHSSAFAAVRQDAPASLLSEALYTQGWSLQPQQELKRICQCPSTLILKSYFTSMTCTQGSGNCARRPCGNRAWRVSSDFFGGAFIFISIWLSFHR